MLPILRQQSHAVCSCDVSSSATIRRKTRPHNRSEKCWRQVPAILGTMGMSRGYRFLVLAVPLIVARPALGCEPVVPFMQVMAPALALSGSILVLAAAVVAKSALFAFFERRLPHLRAAWRMFLGNVLTSFVGILVGVMIASGAGAWLVGVPVVCLLCWLPSKRLVRVAPLAWLGRTSPAVLAGIMTGALLASCIMFMVGRAAMENHQLITYWIIKLAAIFLALLASVMLTTVWEEWVIWRLSSRPEDTNFFGSVLRTNLYILVLVMAVPAVLILPKRLKSPDFLAKRRNPTVAQTTAPHR